MEETNMNSIIKFLSKKLLAEESGPKRQILCELLIEEINNTLDIQEINVEPPFTATSTPIIEQQPVVEEDNIIEREPTIVTPEIPGEGSSNSNHQQTTLIVNHVQFNHSYSIAK